MASHSVSNLAAKLFHGPEHFISFSSKQILVSMFRKEAGHVLTPFSHHHPEYEFIIPLTPIPSLSYLGETHFGSPGNVYPVHTGFEHGISSPVEDVSFLSILIDPHFMESVLASNPEFRDCEFGPGFPVPPKVNDLLFWFYQESTGPISSESVLRHLGALFCLELARGGLTIPEDSKKETDPLPRLSISECADFIQTHLGEDLTLDALAGRCGLSKYHFLRKFKETHGIPPLQYLIEARLSMAASLLEMSPHLSLSDISYRCGFASPTRFCEQFRLKTGFTPGDFRKKKTVNL